MGTKEHQIKHTESSELEFVFELYDEAIRYQKEKGFPVWKSFDRNVLVTDVQLRNHYKVVVDCRIAMVFSVCYSDSPIWTQMEKGDAVYLHRIVVNPSFKGQRLFSSVVEWVVDHAKLRGLKYVRMDTWSSNSTLIDYYRSYGFNFVKYAKTLDSPDLPVQNRNLSLALLQMEL